MRASVSLWSHPSDGPWTAHFDSSTGLACRLDLGGPLDPSVHFDTTDAGGTIVQLRESAANMLRLADMLDGRRLDVQAAEQREKDAYNADLAALRFKLTGECA